ncbi:MAG: DUF3667 domain-containing protein [Betaproteobacteria bacterium]
MKGTAGRPDDDRRAASASASAAIPDACRNCGAAVTGAFCPSCGQETRLALPNARQFLREAAGRYVALDGRLWRTLFGLLFRPGFLTREYFAGRRRRYVRPARLFLVLSLALFALLRFTGDLPVLVAGDTPGRDATIVRSDNGVDIALDDDMNVRVEGIDGVLPGRLKQRLERFNKQPRQQKVEQLFQGAIRYGPYAMFALLPAFAVLLLIVYAGRWRRYPLRPRKYAEHLVFGAHNHAFICLALMLATIPFGPLRTALAVWIAVYFLWAMKAVYGGRWSGIVARAIVIALAYGFLFALVVVGLLFAAVLLA